MHLASQLRSLALSVSDAELKLAGRTEILDCMMDLHNDLNRWSVNTDHEIAAQEVTAILDQYLQKVQQLGLSKTTNRR